MNELSSRISEWIRGRVIEAGAKGVVLGMSGGLDSSVTAALCKKAFPDTTLGLILPCFSPKEDVEHAKMVAKQFGIETKEIDISNIFKFFLSTLKEREYGRDAKEEIDIAVANLKPRLRMSYLYYFANKLNYLVVGTGNKSELTIGYFCYDENTRALTKESLKSYNELEPGDVVFSLDLDTAHVVECPIAGIYVFDYDGDMMSYGGGRKSRIDLMVTPNHRMLIDKRGLRFCHADKLPRRPTPTPTPKPWKGIQSPQPAFEFDNEGIGVNARRFLPMPMEDFLYVLGLYIGDGHAETSTIMQHVKRGNAPRRDPQTGKFAYIDSPAIPKEYTGYRTWFALPEETHASARSKLIAILEKNGIVYGTTLTQIWAYGRPFYQAMAACGTSAHTKQIPAFVLDFQAEYLELLLEGLMESDGGKHSYYYTISKRLAEQIVELGCKTGKNVLLRTRPPRTSVRADGVEIRGSASYEISIYGKGHRWIRGAKFKRVHYQGKVWCPDVPGTHNLLIERNGRFLFCGNTKYGDGAADILPLGDLLKTEERKLAEELDIPKEIIEKKPSAGLWKGQTDESEIGMSYDELDKIILALESGDLSGCDPELVARVKQMVEASRHKREKITVFKKSYLFS